MANHKSAQKRARQTKVRTERNRFYRTRMKNIVKNVRVAVENGEKEKANEAFKVANRVIHSYVSKGFLKKNSAARKVGRLAKLLNSIDQAA